MSTGNHCRVTRIHITYIFARAQDFPPWAFIKHLLQTQQVQKRHCQGFSSQGGLREWMKSACLWDAHNVVAAEWWWAGAGGGWGVRQCFLMEVSPARYQFPFTKCQGSSPVIESTTKCPSTFPASLCHWEPLWWQDGLTLQTQCWRTS